MTPTNKCQHDGEMKTGWDELTCKKCFWILPSGQRIGIHFGWFPSHEAHKEFKKYRTYTGMDNTYPIDTTKYDEVQNMTKTNNDEAFHKIMAQVQVYASSYSLVGTRFATDNQLEEADREKLALYNMVKSALSQSPISQNEQQEEWISVDIRLPSAMQEVLLTNSDGYFVHGKPLFHNSTGEFNCWIYTLYSQDVLDFITQYRPTHWMPLPASPTTSETNTEVGNDMV